MQMKMNRTMAITAMFVSIAVLLALSLAFVKGGKGLWAKKEGFEQVPKFVWYKAEWCSHCQAMKPAWEAAKSEASSLPVEFKVVDEADDKDLVERKGISGFPTLRLEMPDGNEIEYGNARTSEAMVSFLKENLKI